MKKNLWSYLLFELDYKTEKETSLASIYFFLVSALLFSISYFSKDAFFSIVLYFASLVYFVLSVHFFSIFVRLRYKKDMTYLVAIFYTFSLFFAVLLFFIPVSAVSITSLLSSLALSVLPLIFSDEVIKFVEKKFFLAIPLTLNLTLSNGSLGLSGASLNFSGSDILDFVIAKATALMGENWPFFLLALAIIFLLILKFLKLILKFIIVILIIFIIVKYLPSLL